MTNQSKRPGLNRGSSRALDALLAGSKAVASSNTPVIDTKAGDSLQSLPIELIVRGAYQPRRNFDAEALQELADSIQEQGVLQPIIVRKTGEKFEIIAGERRWRAAQLAGLGEVPAVIKILDDKAAAAAALIENIQRQDLNPLEESQALQRLIDEFDLTHQEAAQAVGRSRTGVTNLLRLLELPEEVKALVDKGVLSMGHARAILGLPQSLQTEVARQVAHKGLSVREAERLVKAMQQQQKPHKEPKKDADISAVERDLSDKLMAQVKLQHANSGRGKLIISYNSLDELDGILAHIK